MATQMKPNLELSSLLRDIRPGDDRTLERIAKLLAAGEVCTIMDSARFTDNLSPDSFPESRDLAAACRVAVAYGDLSGLEGLR